MRVASQRSNKRLPEWALIIIKQLNGRGVQTLITMLGTTYVSYSEADKRVEFDYKGCRESNKVLITLVDDLYTVAFWKIPTANQMLKGKFPIETARYEGVYAEKLKELFQSETGLYLNLR